MKRIISLMLALCLMLGLAGAMADELPDIEVQSGNTGWLESGRGGKVYNMYKDLFGVGVYAPYIPWEDYQTQIGLRIAANEAPDIFYVPSGMENDLITSGAVLDLTDLLPESCPHLWNLIPETAWDTVRRADPTGQGRIWFVPQVLNYSRYAGLIRKDWLDKLGLNMPTTQDEFVEVLRAFKTQDPNGNGMADEIPTGGRAEARWMDHLFAMYGIAMHEGFPQWDIYDGELTYSAVTKNMRDCLLWLSELYEEGLLDEETLLNDKASWEGKISNNQVGVYFHWAEYTYEKLNAIFESTGAEADYAVLPAISADGYEAFYNHMDYQGAQFLVRKTDDPAPIDACLKVLDAYGNTDLWLDFWMGVEGMHHPVMEDGTKVKLADDPQNMELLTLQPYNVIATPDFMVTMLNAAKNDKNAWMYDISIRNLKDAQAYGKTIAGSGLPSSVYDGFSDIQNRTLFVEYASKIIIGEWPIEKFDEFVDRWYAEGGQTVTERARAWYGSAD